MSNQEYWVFHPMRYLSLLAIPNTHIFHFLFLLCDYETHFGRCPILLSPPSNTKHSVNLPCTHNIYTIKHQTQCQSLPCTHTHVMRCPVPKGNAMPLHVSHATCTMNDTCNNSKSYFMPSIIIIFNTYIYSYLIFQMSNTYISTCFTIQ